MKEKKIEEWIHNAHVSYKYPVEYVQSKLPSCLQVVPFEDEEGQHAILTEWHFYQYNARSNPAVVPKFVGYLAAAPDLHVQTYVRHEDGREGLFCFKIWMGKKMACWMGRNFFDAPMYSGTQSLNKTKDGVLEYKCKFTDPKSKVCEQTTFRYKPLGEPSEPPEDSIDHFTVNRFTNRQFTYFKDKLKSLPNQQKPFPLTVQAIEVHEHTSNILESLFSELPMPEPCQRISWSDTICHVFEENKSN